MTEEKRTNKKPGPHELKKALNSKQITALREIRHLGWELKFVRQPVFQEAIPVVYNDKLEQIGILDTDGNISLEHEFDVRSDSPEQGQQPQDAETWQEKRKGMAAIPDNIDELLNQYQKSALRQIETFGWKLHFFRRPLFQEPVTGIISPNGDRVAIINLDGRINLIPDSDIRKPVSAGQTDPAPSSAASAGLFTDAVTEKSD